jgi:hypothetical protein
VAVALLAAASKLVDRHLAREGWRAVGTVPPWWDRRPAPALKPTSDTLG